MSDYADRFWQKVDRQPEGCWLWIAKRATNGYGQFFIAGRMRPAHRVAYELLVGPIEPGKELDHLCHVRRCVNPDHVRVATHAENAENLSGAYRSSHTGVRGVTWRSKKQMYQVRVQHHGVSIHVGYFKSVEEAEAAAINKRQSIFAVPGGSRRLPQSA